MEIDQEQSASPSATSANGQTDNTQPDEPGAGWWQTIRASLKGSEEDFTRGSLNRAVAMLSIPMVLEMAGEAVFAITDAFFVAQLGHEALAAVGLTESLLELVYAIAIGLSMATTAMVARRIGEKKPRLAAKAAVQAIVIGVAVSLVLGVVGAIFSKDLLMLMGADDATATIGASYTRIIYGAMVVVVLLFLNNAIFRGAGDATSAMRALWLANAINVVLDPCLIFGLGPFPELGLMGAAVATTIGRGIGVVYQLVGLTRSKRIQIGWADLGIDSTIVKRLLRVSAGGIGQMLIATASWVCLIRILATFGSIVLGGYVVAIRVVIFVILPAWGVSNAAATLVGQNLGAGRADRAERAVWITGFWNMMFMAVVSVVFLFFSRPIIEVFTGGAEDMTAIGANALRIISYGYIFYAWGMVMMQAFNGAGDTVTPTWINFFCFWMFQIPLAYVLAKPVGMGPPGVFWSIGLSYSLSAVVGIVWFRRGSWKHQRV